MHRGVVVGKGTNFITTAAGETAIRNMGINPIIVNVAESDFYAKLKQKGKNISE
jgi:hypothetical protein